MKLFSTILIFTWICFIEATNSTLENYLRNSLLKFKDQMKTGIPDLNIPVLDPYNVPDVHLKENNENTKLDVDLKDVKITGLSDFQIADLTVETSNLKAQLALKTNKVRGEGQYKLDGVVLSFFPLTGDGDFWIEATEVISKGSVNLEREENHLKITDLKLELESSSISGHFDNILGGGDLGEIVNTILNKFGKKIFDAYSPKLMEKINKSFIEKANEELKNFPLD